MYKKQGKKPIYLVHRHNYKLAQSLLPGEEIHRFADQMEDQVQKTIYLSRQNHDIYCHFGEEPASLSDTRLMRHFRKVAYLGPPWEHTINSHILVHGSCDAKTLKYLCHRETRLLTGPKFSFPLSGFYQDGSSLKSCILFLYQQPERRVMELLESVFRDLGLEVSILSPPECMRFPLVDHIDLICTDADCHVQELSSVYKDLIVFAGYTDQLRLCYAIDAAGLGTSLGWIPALEREALKILLENHLEHHQGHSLHVKGKIPLFFETIYRMLDGGEK